MDMVLLGLAPWLKLEVPLDVMDPVILGVTVSLLLTVILSVPELEELVEADGVKEEDRVMDMVLLGLAPWLKLEVPLEVKEPVLLGVTLLLLVTVMDGVLDPLLDGVTLGDKVLLELAPLLRLEVLEEVKDAVMLGEDEKLPDMLLDPVTLTVKLRL